MFFSVASADHGMPDLSRRQVIRAGSGAGVVALAGCVSGLTSGSAPRTPATEAPSCTEYAYTEPDSTAEGDLPWHLHVRNVALSSHPLGISIEELGSGTPREVVACTAATDEQTAFVFDLSPDTRYRVTATLSRPDGPERASATVSGWNRVTATNAALEVTVEDGELDVYRIHYDRGAPADEE